MDRGSDKSQHSHSRKSASNRSKHHENKAGSQKHTISYLLNDRSQEEKPNELTGNIGLSSEQGFQHLRMNAGPSRNSFQSRNKASRGHSSPKDEPILPRTHCSDCDKTFSSRSDLEEQCVCRLIILYRLDMMKESMSSSRLMLTSSKRPCFPLNLQFIPASSLSFIPMSSVFIRI